MFKQSLKMIKIRESEQLCQRWKNKYSHYDLVRLSDDEIMQKLQIMNMKTDSNSNDKLLILEF
jgi:hypothetical protein